MNAAPRIAATFASGLVFGLGLSISGMLDPVRVRGFLDVTGRWDPSLVFVLGGAVAVSLLGFQLSRRMRRPAFDNGFRLPATTPIDARLVGGSALFGIGWGMAGLCPGPAIAGLALGVLPILGFVVAMIAGMISHDVLFRSGPKL